MGGVLACPLSVAQTAPSAGAASADVLQEIIVTATKRAESIQEIPLSITAVTGEMLENRSAFNFDDYARGIANLSFTDNGVGRERIAIRGVDSKTGTSTVGYYYDETPIPDSSSVSAEKVSFDPDLVDINRVEILRGPQGTVFGSGSMGGTIRLIPNEPNPTRQEFNLKTILSHTEHGNGPASTFSGMLNLPLVDGKLAVRLVGWARWEPGFIFREAATPESHQANVASGGATPVVFVSTGATVPAGESFGGRVALRYDVNDRTAIDASLFSDQQFYRGFQDITTGPQNPNDDLVQRFLFDIQEQNRNRLTISNLKLTSDLGWSDLITSLSYTRRLLHLWEESAAALESVGFAPAFNAAPIVEEGRDNSFSAEARLSSSHSGSHASDSLQWLVGLFYFYQKGWTKVKWVVPGFTDHFGNLTGPVDGDNLYNTNAVSWTHQTALFGEVNYSPVQKLKLTAGIRFFDYKRTDAQPQNGLFAGVNSAVEPDPYTAPTVSGSANSAVYKGAVSWQQTPNLLFYAQASEGFRGPFGKSAIPSACDAEAAALGGSTAQGVVEADKLWNYELGMKSTWLNNRLRVNVAGFRIDWTNIQQSIFLLCGYPLLENLGSVRNQGGELETDWRVSEAWSVGGALGIVNSALQQDIYGIPGSKGQPLPDVPQTSGNVYISYDFPVAASWHGNARVDYAYTDHTLSTYGVGQTFTPDKKAISMLNARLGFQRSDMEIVLFAQNILNNVERVSLERDVSLDVANRLRYTVNRPRTIGIEFSFRH
jgi:outer membrane receptor protein involved in Fe transport